MVTWGDGKRPAGDGDDRTPPAGQAFRIQVAHAQAAWNAALRRRRGRKRPGARYRPGMSRRPPPEPDGDDAA